MRTRVSKMDRRKGQRHSCALASVQQVGTRMIAKIAYLTSPGPNRYVLNIQMFGSEGIERIEITEAHLANIVIDGASFALRKTRVSIPHTESAEDDRAGA